jgi:hypothetical protein
VSATVLIHAGLQAILRHANIDHGLVEDKSVDPRINGGFRTEFELVVNHLPNTQRLEACRKQYRGGCLHSFCGLNLDHIGRTLHFDGPLQSVCDPGVNEHFANVLIPYVQNLADFGAQISGAGKRADFVGGRFEAAHNFIGGSTALNVGRTGNKEYYHILKKLDNNDRGQHALPI